MAPTVVLHKPNFDTFVNWLKMYIEEMKQRYLTEKGTEIWIEHIDDHLYEWKYPDDRFGLPGWIYEVQILVDPPNPSPENSGALSCEITPLNHPYYDAGIEVVFKLSEASAEQDEWFLELIEALAVRWPEAAEQLTDQGIVFRNQALGYANTEERARPETEQSTKDDLIAGNQPPPALLIAETWGSPHDRIVFSHRGAPPSQALPDYSRVPTVRVFEPRPEGDGGVPQPAKALLPPPTAPTPASRPVSRLGQIVPFFPLLPPKKRIVSGYVAILTLL